MLSEIARDLAGWPLSTTDNGLHLQLDEKLQVEIARQNKRLFMASILSSRFSCSGRFPQSAACRIRIHQPGWLRRQPVRFSSRQAAGKSIATHLNGFASLRQTLCELDYRRIELLVDAQGWRCTIEPWAASEVICRLPPLRRYLRLVPQQRMLLLSSLKMINEALILFPHNRC